MITGSSAAYTEQTTRVQLNLNPTTLQLLLGRKELSVGVINNILMRLTKKNTVMYWSFTCYIKKWR